MTPKYRYEVIIYNDKADANPRKIRFDYIAASKEDAREYGEQFAKNACGFFNQLVSVHVEFREEIKEPVMIPIALDDNSDNRLIIALSVIDQCNKLQIIGEDAFWKKFAELYNDRVPGESGEEAAAFFKQFLRS